MAGSPMETYSNNLKSIVDVSKPPCLKVIPGLSAVVKVDKETAISNKSYLETSSPFSMSSRNQTRMNETETIRPKALLHRNDFGLVLSPTTINRTHL